MAKRSVGLLSGRSRHLARHHKPSQLKIRSIIKEFAIGERVAIIPKGNFGNIPHPRYKGKIGVVTGTRGSAYVVAINAMDSKRTLIVLPRYLERVGIPAKKAGTE